MAEVSAGARDYPISFQQHLYIDNEKEVIQMGVTGRSLDPVDTPTA